MKEGADSVTYCATCDDDTAATFSGRFVRDRTIFAPAKVIGHQDSGVWGMAGCLDCLCSSNGEPQPLIPPSSLCAGRLLSLSLGKDFPMEPCQDACRGRSERCGGKENVGDEREDGRRQGV